MSETPQFALQKLYIKDSSFESPNVPDMFTITPRPEVNLQVQTNVKPWRDSVEVCLKMTVTVKVDNQVAYVVELEQAGLFVVKGYEGESETQMLEVICPEILYPYARESIDALIVRGGFPALMLHPIDFRTIYQQRRQQPAENAPANVEVSAPDQTTLN